MKKLLQSFAISVLGPVALIGGTVLLVSLMPQSTVNTPPTLSSNDLAYIPPSVPTDQNPNRIPNPFPPGGGEGSFPALPIAYLVFNPETQQVEKTEFKAASGKTGWMNFYLVKLISEGSRSDEISRELSKRYGESTPAYEFDNSDGERIAFITKTSLGREELKAVVASLKTKLEGEDNSFERIDRANAEKPDAISEAVATKLQSDAIAVFSKNVQGNEGTSLIVFCSDENSRLKKIQKEAKKAAKRIKTNRPDVLFVDTHDWLNAKILQSSEVAAASGPIYLLVDQKRNLLGRLESSTATVEELMEFISKNNTDGKSSQ